MLLQKCNQLNELKINLKWQLKLEKYPRQLELIKEVQEKIKKLEEEIERILNNNYSK